jgi:hypothetical protein
MGIRDGEEVGRWGERVNAILLLSPLPHTSAFLFASLALESGRASTTLFFLKNSVISQMTSYICSQ